MCSMIACILIPGFELRAALRTRPRLQIRPAALAPLSGQEQLLGPVTAAAEAVGVRPGMRIGEALDTRVVERLYGGLEPALKRALAAVGSAWDPRAGAAQRRFAALAAASIARPGQALVVSDERTREFLAPLELSLLPLERERREELRELGVRKIGELAGLPGAAVAERMGPSGRRAWSLARGGGKIGRA